MCFHHKHQASDGADDNSLEHRMLMQGIQIFNKQNKEMDQETKSFSERQKGVHNAASAMIPHLPGYFDSSTEVNPQF